LKMMARALGVRLGLACVVVWVAAAGCSRVRRDSRVCDDRNPCRAGFHCDLTANRCVPGDEPDAEAPPPSTDGGGAGPRDQVGGSCATSDNCPPAAPRCVASRCVECLAGMDLAHCPPSRPVCVGNSCVSCMGAAPSACATRDPATPVCSGGQCLACTAMAGCDATPLRPVCVAGACVSCAMDPAGCGRRTATPVCRATTGDCVECTDATAPCQVPTRPICTPEGRCVACANDMACAQKSPMRPACDSGSCVECTADRHCAGAKPICEVAAKRCAPCTTDAQCMAKGGGPGVCMEDGRCATDAETILVGPGAGTTCPPAAPAAPLRCPAEAINSGLTAQRKVVVIRGPVADFGLAPPTALGRITIVGQDGNVKPPRDRVGIRVTAGDVLVRNLTVAGGETQDSHGIRVTGSGTKLALSSVIVEGNAGTGVIAEAGAELRLNRCMIKGNRGGVLVNGAAFHVENTVVAANMGALVAGSSISFGGVYLGAAAGGRAMTFRNNTIVDNLAAGLICSGPYQVKGLLAANNAIEQVVGCAHGAGSVVGMAPAFDPARPYHITPMSPCYNTGDPTDFPDEDIDGDRRPHGLRSDCGADEVVR
jgi:hypothetical protein